MAEKFTVGLIQMSCSPDPRENFAKVEARIREAASRGAQIICTQELFRSQYFCREENADLFELAEPIPGPSSEALSKLARELKVVIVGSLFERRAAGHLSQYCRDSGCRRIARSANIARCTSRTIRSITRNFISLRATWAFRISIRNSAASACWSAGTSGIRKARAWRASAARTLFSTPRRSAGIPSEKQEFGAAQLDAWRTIQRSHAIANGVFVAAVNRVGFEGPPKAASNSGDIPSSATRLAECSPRHPPTRKKS